MPFQIDDMLVLEIGQARFPDGTKFETSTSIVRVLVVESFPAVLNWRLAIKTAVGMGVAIPAMTASLAYFDSYRTAILPQNLTQAQRDYFGSHTYERADHLERGHIHTDWIAEG